MYQQIHQLFSEQVKLTPESIALQMNEETMTYSELDLLSNKIANSLIQNGVTKNDIIGVSLNRGFDLIASLLGILKAGCAYLPLDKEYPQERLNYMLEHSQAKLLIYDNDNLNFSNSFKVNYLKSYESQDLGNVGDLAYVIYTSGSTGNPKGVCLDHAALINLLHHQKSENSNVVTLQFTPISFDVQFQEIFSTLTTGGKLVLIDELTRLDFNNLLSVIFKANIERIFLPFVALSKLAQVATNKNLYPTNLKYVTTAGEQLRITNSIRLFF